MNIALALEQVGLTKKEAEAYVALLQSGTQPASVIARKINAPRSTAHFLCECLVKKLFATQSKRKNTFLFTAELPKNVVRILENIKDKEVEEKESQIDFLKRLVPEMEGMLSQYTDIPKVTLYEGMSAMTHLFKKIYAQDVGDRYTFSASNYALEVHPEQVEELRKISSQQLKGSKELVIDSHKYKKNNKGREVHGHEFKYFPSKDFVLQTHIEIFGDSVLLSYVEDNPVGVLVEHKGMADNLKRLHQEMWKVL